jgi:hypothetical protein
MLPDTKDPNFLQRVKNLLEDYLDHKGKGREAHGLGTAAMANVGISAGEVPTNEGTESRLLFIRGGVFSNKGTYATTDTAKTLDYFEETTIYCHDTADFPEAGPLLHVIIGGGAEYLRYTGKDGNKITGVSGLVSTPVRAGDVIIPLYVASGYATSYSGSGGLECKFGPFSYQFPVLGGTAILVDPDMVANADVFSYTGGDGASSELTGVTGLANFTAAVSRMVYALDGITTTDLSLSFSELTLNSDPTDRYQKNGAAMLASTSEPGYKIIKYTGISGRVMSLSDTYAVAAGTYYVIPLHSSVIVGAAHGQIIMEGNQSGLLRYSQVATDGSYGINLDPDQVALFGEYDTAHGTLQADVNDDGATRPSIHQSNRTRAHIQLCGPVQYFSSPNALFRDHIDFDEVTNTYTFVADNDLKGKILCAGVNKIGQGCLTGKTANQSIPSSTWTVLNWDTEVYDDGGLHSSVTLNNRITVGADISRVTFAFGVVWGSNASGYRAMRLMKNGAVVAGGGKLRIPAISGGQEMCIHSASIPVVSGDYFYVEAFQNSGAAIDIVADESSFFGVQVTL